MSLFQVPGKQQTSAVKCWKPGFRNLGFGSLGFSLACVRMGAPHVMQGRFSAQHFSSSHVYCFLPSLLARRCRSKHTLVNRKTWEGGKEIESHTLNILDCVKKRWTDRERTDLI
ncbi:hypothetical protein R1flu_019893 [Riccia fluitans]|uniref:Uncharacterized protein n=1 Tax=Riccia fluitans TaxID=41844 RepID=A0ABD1ZJY8_9MARC